jgi:hypothetical protein
MADKCQPFVFISLIGVSIFKNIEAEFQSICVMEKKLKS